MNLHSQKLLLECHPPQKASRALRLCRLHDDFQEYNEVILILRFSSISESYLFARGNWSKCRKSLGYSQISYPPQNLFTHEKLVFLGVNGMRFDFNIESACQRKDFLDSARCIYRCKRIKEIGQVVAFYKNT